MSYIPPRSLRLNENSINQASSIKPDDLSQDDKTFAQNVSPDPSTKGSKAKTMKKIQIGSMKNPLTKKGSYARF